MVSKRLAGMAAVFIIFGVFFIQCEEKKVMGERSFQEDVAFLQQYTKVVVLSDEEGMAQVAVCPELQGRIMTSTAKGKDGTAFGWINYGFFKTGEQNPHMNAYGGEDRLWLGPEGGQYSIFFKPQVPMTFENWFTPPPINSEAWVLKESAKDRTAMQKQMRLTNYSGFEFDLRIDRNVQLLPAASVEDLLKIDLPKSVEFVAYETENVMTNAGPKPWEEKTGTLSIWMLDMLKTGPRATVVVPYKSGDEAELGPVATTNYFGEIPPDRIKMEDGVLYFRVDGKQRGKLGLSWHRTKAVAGSYDADNRLLTLISFNLPETPKVYVNSMWEIQEQPFKGDALNSYNDGPLADGSQMGPFYEIESSSPAAFLKPGESIVHYHRVYHFIGQEKDLDGIAQAVLGVGLKKITSAFAG